MDGFFSLILQVLEIIVDTFDNFHLTLFDKNFNFINLASFMLIGAFTNNLLNGGDDDDI